MVNSFGTCRSPPLCASTMSDIDTEMAPALDHGEEPSDEGEGDKINPLSDDSSEEAPTDEEEAVQFRQGFIVDDDDEEEGEEEDEDEERRHNRRRKRRRRRTWIPSNSTL